MEIDRRRGFRPTALLLVGLFVATTPASAEDKTYPIKLTRPTAVGRKHEISAEGAIMRKIVVVLAGVRKEQPQSGEGIKLDAEVEVLAVTPKGRASILSIKVKHCVRDSGGNEAEFLPAGSIVVAEAKDKETTFTLKGGELPPSAPSLLRLFFNFKDDTRATEDELVGTADAQPVGASWSVNGEGMVKDLAAEDLVIHAADVSGSTKLEAVEPAKDGRPECLRIVNRLTIKHLEAQRPAEVLKGMPPGIDSAKGSARYQVTQSLPASTDGEALDRTFSIRNEMTFSGTANDGRPIEIETTSERAGTVHIR